MNLFNIAGWSWLWEIINGLMLMICNLIYWAISLLYQVFVAVAKVNLFSREVFKELTSRMYVVIAIAMLFIFAYNIILMIVNPDDKKTMGQGGKLVKEAVTSFVLIILLPTIFNWLYVFQNNVLDSNIIGTVILGSVGSTSVNHGTDCDPNDFDCHCDFTGYGLDQYITDDDWWFDDTDNVEREIHDACVAYKNTSPSQRGAYMIPPLLMSTFYRPKNYTYNTCVEFVQGNTSLITDSEEQKVCRNYFYDVNMARYTGNINGFVDDTYLRQIVSDSDLSIVEFNWLWAIVAGVLAAYMFLCYAMEIGVRVAKLGFLQIISPLPVMMRVIPKQKEAMYDKWVKQIVDTYTDVFVRLAIIYFTLFAVSLVPDVIDAMTAGFQASHAQTGGGIGGFVIISFAKVFVILGILKFAQDCPKLIKEFLGGSGKFSLKSPAKQISENKAAMAGLGAIGAGAASAAGNFRKTGSLGSAIGGLAGGARRGLQNGYKSKNFGDLKGGIMSAKYDSDAAREKHAATKLRGATTKNGNHVPGFAQSLVGSYKDAKDAVIRKYNDFDRFISGEGATDYRAKAVEDMFSKNSRLKDTFANAVVKGIESAQVKMSEDYNSNKDVNVNGIKYTRKEDGQWHGSDGSIVPHQDGKDKNGNDVKGMNTLIKEAFDDMKKKAYAQQYAKNMDAYKELSDSMIKSLSENMGKLGSEFSTKFFDKINNCGLSLDVNTIDDLATKIGDFQSSKNFEALYQINDTIEGVLKEAKATNAAAAAAAKDKK